MRKSGPPLSRFLPQGILFASLLAIYLRTLAPGLSWANVGTDGGDLIAAAATGGIAHPTGYPLYVLLARLFQSLPIGSLAYRTNLMSAVLTSLAALLVYGIVAHAPPTAQSLSKKVAALAAGLAFGLAPLVWSQAVITEVYALQSLLIALILYFYTVQVSVFRLHPNLFDYLRGLLLGLALSNHITAVLLIPMALALGSFRGQADPVDNSGRVRSRVDPASLLRQLLGLAMGISPYLILPLRALAGPAMNWGYPVTLRNFWWLVSGQLYQSYYLRATLPEVWVHVQSAASLCFEQFGLAGVLIAIIGLIWFGSRTRIYVLTSWIAVTSAVFAILYRAQDSYLYLIPVFLCFAIWIGLGVSGITFRFLPRSLPLQLSLGVIAAGYFLLRSIAFVGDVDASKDLEAETFGREILTSAPANAILFADGDRAVFALWYFHLALRERPDLVILAVDLLHFDWYQRNLHDLYPSLKLPGPFPWPESIAIANPSRPTCHVDFTGDAEMQCSAPAPDP